jgi:plastocyanin
MRRSGLRGVALVLMMVLSLGLLAACGDDDDDAVEGAVDTATEAVGDAAGEATGAAGDAVEGATDEAGDAAGDATDGDGAGGGGEGATLEIPAAEQGFAFAKTAVTAQAGTVTLSMPNPSTLEHNIAVDEPEQEVGDTVGQGDTSEITVDFPAGEYEYYCAVPGHREGGMVGTLTVQ